MFSSTSPTRRWRWIYGQERLEKNWPGSSKKERCIILVQLRQCSLYEYLDTYSREHICMLLDPVAGQAD